ncbi:MAG: Mur ligase family protein [Candidatus Paceibacterota bacterium]|jgi:UDP-N-acetylmuramate--alanine ligase
MKIYFIGIGGIGVSALAQYYLQKNNEVFGSDATASEITEMMEKMGAKIIIGEQSENNIKENYDLLIYSPAVKNDNPELVIAQKKGIKCLSYPEALGELTKEYFTIAITGTHGKSTTTSMIAMMLIKAGMDPTVIVGTKLKEFNNSNFRMGNSKYLVIEACEHEASFLYYWPQIAVVTNMEEDHLDYYKNFENIEKAFNEFTGHLSEKGLLIKKSDINLKTKAKIIDFEINQIEAQKLQSIMKVPGEHNILNALAAMEVGKALEIPENIIFASLGEFYGTWRRFDVIDLPNNLVLIDDYAHHPTEIKATLKAARQKYSNQQIYCFFQPHQYQRTQFLWEEFINVFKNSLDEKLVDKLYIVDVYDVVGREGGDIAKNYNSKILAEKIGDSAIYIGTKENINKYFPEQDAVVIIMGAGNIYNISVEIKAKHLGTCID